MKSVDAVLRRIEAKQRKIRQLERQICGLRDIAASMVIPETILNRYPLTARQREIIGLVAANKGNKEIANELDITLRTVKFHVSNLLKRFGKSSRAELAQLAIQRTK